MMRLGCWLSRGADLTRTRVVLATGWLVVFAAAGCICPAGPDPMPSTPGEVSGRVLDATARDVTVELSRLAGEVVDTVLADRTGEYRFEKVVPGDYVLAVRSDAASEQIEVEVRSKQRTEVVWSFEEEEPGSDGNPGHGDRFVAGEPTFADLP